MDRTSTQCLARRIWPKERVKVRFFPLFGNPALQDDNQHWKGEVLDGSGRILLSCPYIQGREPAEVYLRRVLIGMEPDRG